MCNVYQKKNFLVNLTIGNLTDPIFITLKIPPPTYSETTPLVPVWNNNGTWSTNNCFFSHEYSEHTVFYCHSFGYYALKQDISHVESIIGAKFKLCHPAIYVGGFILFTSFFIAIMTYLIGYGSIQMPKKAKHSLINLWISVCCLCFMYIFGIYQTENLRICQIVGMLLHYFTLSTLLWMCVGVNCMYKRLSKNDIMGLQDDELPSDQPIKKPILGLYFVGWGVAVIVCGISAAININDYSSGEYCFLRMGPPISALYIPFAILVLFLAVFFLLVRCTIYGMDANGHLSEGTQATENVDLDLLEPNFPENRSVFTGSSKTASSEVEDLEHSPSAQLKAYLIFLVLYIMCWLSCALSTVQPYGFVSFETDLFSVTFALLAAVLGAFTLFFYCIARSDVRELWIALMRHVRGRKPCLRSRNVSDTVQNLSHIQVQALPIPQITNSLEMQITSRSSSRSSGRPKSHNSNILKGAVDLNSVQYSSDGAKINNVNLIVLHRQQYRDTVIPNIIENPTNAAEVFYNPHQSIVARKFFKRQKRHMMKRNNLVPHPRDSDSTSAISAKVKATSNMDRSMFGTNSKVNNTNIHVEHIHTNHQKNPNIFSDSAEDYEQPDVPVQNIVLNAERLRRRELLKHRTRKKFNQPESMRSVSQQCTLEYSSENISDSILDNKTSPDKTTTTPPPPLKIYVNPSHGFVEKTGPSSDLDEIYQQIRRRPNNPRNSPCLSESDITSYVNNRTGSEDVETTV